MLADDHGCECGVRGRFWKKLTEVAEWTMDTLPNCATCRKIYGERTPPEEPPCDTCRPPLHEDNKDAFFIYSFVQNQFIMGPAGPVDINHMAIWEAVDRFKIKDGIGVFRKVVHLSRWMVERLNREDRGK
jgi:hypothetical protein